VSSQVFRTFWLQPELSPVEHLCIKSFLAHGHRFQLYSYADVANVPEGCEVEDARRVLPEERVFFYKAGYHAGSVSAFSNIFRYELLARDGGWWVDSDLLCLTADVPETDYAFAKEGPILYGTAALKAPAESELMKRALSRAERIGEEAELGDLGPRVLTGVISELGLDGEAWERQEMYPLPWVEALATFNPDRAGEIEQKLASARFAHLWTSILRLANVLKAVRPPEGSYLATCYERYEVPFGTDLRYRWSDMRGLNGILQEYWSARERLGQLSGEPAPIVPPPRRIRRLFSRR
jgi:hypothetical protein